MSRTQRTVAIAAVLALLIAGGLALVVRNTVHKPMTIAALFTSATAIYPGDDVRVAGVKVGTIKAIEPQGTTAKMTLAVDRTVPIPAEARAVIVAQNLVGSRYVQLAPAFGADGDTSGPRMRAGDVIGLERTAVPVEWDEIKTQLTRLATDLGPNAASSTSSVGRFIDSAANALDGNGDKLRETIRQLTGLSRILADGSGNVTDIIANLQTFVTVLRDSNAQIVQFQDRLATVSSVLDESRSDLDAALTNLTSAVDDVQRFVAGSRNQTAEQVGRLSDVVRNLSDNQTALKNLLHVAPNAIGNSYNIYNPDIQSALGGFALANFSNPLQVVCAAIGAIENATASETGKLCSQYLGPALRLINFNYLPMPFNAYLGKSPSPWNLIYSEPHLAPGGDGTAPTVEIPPEISAYTGLNGDVPPPPGWGNPAGPRGAYAPAGLPADPQPALYPGAPVPAGVPHGPVPSGPSTLPGMLMPAEVPAPAAAPVPPPPPVPLPQGVGATP
jgi:phospholipid/cholesterol/gamma-HCH transport system substrate-binding protein